MRKKSNVFKEQVSYYKLEKKVSQSEVSLTVQPIFYDMSEKYTYSG